jgi:sugar lactone lactonase YvrE
MQGCAERASEREMSASAAQCITATRSTLGECPVWDERAGVLYYADIDAPALIRLDPATGAERRWDLPAKIGSFALDETGAGAVLALAGGFARLDLAKGALAPIADPPAGLDEHRFNDGAADPAGRFWSGTMHVSARRPSGVVYCLEGGEARAVFGGFFVPNGFAWSPDGRRFYVNDSPRAMFVADFDAATGRAEAPYVFADVSAAPGFPDGMAVDAEGFLWNARWDGKGLARFAPDGRLDRFVPMPVSRPTSCAFGGPELDRLYVTSARVGLDAAVLSAEPLAGAVFALDLGVKGLPARRWRAR